MRLHLPLLLVLFGFSPSISAQTPSLGLRIRPGFEVTEFADAKLANDIYCMTVDPKGRIVVSGRGYIRILVDDDNDGRADRAIDFSNTPKDGAMGLLWEGSTLLITGDGGLRRFHDKDGDDKADGPSELIRAMKTGGEHHAHAILRGPDGWLYVLCGNNTGIDKSYAQLITSPIREPVAGCILRFQPDLKASEIIAHGFRNPYGMDFDSDGELFTYDSDNERCVSLPWYEPTRFYHVKEGGHYGWMAPQRATFWRMPPYFPDVVAPICYLGRGSPTGVACYRHAQFPKEYRGTFFLADWTFGKIYSVAPARHANGYTGQPKVFMESTGDNGFAPTALVVHPQSGDLYVSIGGRGTRGAVYRVRYLKGITAELAEEAKKWGINGKGPARAAIAPFPKTVDEAIREAASGADRLHAVRGIQVMLGDIGDPAKRGTVWEGYSIRTGKPRLTVRELGSVQQTFAAMFPSANKTFDRELTRTIAMIQTPPSWNPFASSLAARFTPKSDPVDDLHYLIVFARLEAGSSKFYTGTIAATLRDLDRKIAERGYRRDSHWPLRVKELYAELSRKDPKLNQAMLESPDFGRPDHALFAKAPGFDKYTAARIFLRKVKSDADYALNASVVDVLSYLPADESFPVLRQAWGKSGVDSAILPILGRRPDEMDRDKFIQGLNLPQPELLRVSIEALNHLPSQENGAEILALIRALGNLLDTQKELRAAVSQRLTRLTGQSFAADKQAWTSWFSGAHPGLAGRLNNPDGVDLPGWDKRLSRIDWSLGDESRGRSIFVKASCATCHSGREALGPDLAGVAGRFSRSDLFSAILQPSREVPPRYQATFVETADGKVYQGLVIYEAVDSLILQSGPSATVRVAGEQVASKRTSPISLMPAGLLDSLSDTEIGDLYAYMKGLGKQGRK